MEIKDKVKKRLLELGYKEFIFESHYTYKKINGTVIKYIYVDYSILERGDYDSLPDLFNYHIHSLSSFFMGRKEIEKIVSSFEELEKDIKELKNVIYE